MFGPNLNRLLIDAIEAGTLFKTLQSDNRLGELTQAEKTQAHAGLQQLKLLQKDLAAEQARLSLGFQHNAVHGAKVSLVEPSRPVCLIGIEVSPQNAAKAESTLLHLGYSSDSTSIDLVTTRGSAKHFWLDDGRPFRVRLSCSQTSAPFGGGITSVLSAVQKRIGNKLQRRSLKTAQTNSLGGFLGTPHEMIVPLLDLAKVGPDTALVDLGCGDARVLVEACRHFGCGGIGYELDGDLASQANHMVVESELTDRVTVVHGDAMESDLSHADVVFAFLPVKTLPRLIESVLKKMRIGAVLICHEQEAFSPTPASEKHPIITRQGATIAHIWHVT